MRNSKRAQHDGRSTVIAPDHATRPHGFHAHTRTRSHKRHGRHHTRDALLSSSAGAMTSPSPYNTLSSLYHTLQDNSTRNRPVQSQRPQEDITTDRTLSMINGCARLRSQGEQESRSGRTSAHANRPRHKAPQHACASLSSLASGARDAAN